MLNINLPRKMVIIVAFRRKSRDWMVRKQDNVSESGDMSIRGLLFQ